MKIATKKFIQSRPTQIELSPARKPRFQRTQKCQSTADRLHSRSTGQLSITNINQNGININMKFIPPVVHDGSTNHSPLKYTEQQLKLGLLIKARINKYKRETTPLKTQNNQKQKESMTHLQKLLAQNKELSKIIDQKQLQIAQLQDQNSKLLKRVQKIDKNQGQKQNLIKTCMQLRRQLQQKENKLFILQSSFKQNQDFLVQTKDSLEKLRKQIQQNRITQLVKQKQLLIQKVSILQKRVAFQHEQVMKMDVSNSKLMKDMQILNLTNQKLQRQLFARSNIVQVMKQQSLTKQIVALKQQINISKTGNQKELEEVISQQKNQISQLKQINKTLFVKLDVTLKKLQEKQKTNKKTKNKQLSELQGKFRKFLLEYKNFRKEHNDMVERNLHIYRQNKREIFYDDDDQLSLSYSLTPERSLS